MNNTALAILETKEYPCLDHSPQGMENALAVFIEGLTVKKPKHLILVNPPQIPSRWFDPQVAKMKRYLNYLPTGLLYIAANAHKILPDLKISILDLNHDMLKRATEDDFVYDDWKLSLAAELGQSSETWVGISCMFSHSLEVFYDIIRFVEKQSQTATIIAGGVQSTFAYHDILTKTACNAVIRHEGETQIRNLLACVAFENQEQIPGGTVLKLPNGQLYEFEPDLKKSSDTDLDITPYYSYVDIENYSKYGAVGAFSRFLGLEKPFGSVIRNRGCRARCTFCTVRNFNGQGVRVRKAESVVREIKYLWEEKGIRYIDWLDDDLLYSEKDAVALFKMISDQIPALQWVCNNGLIANAITDELLYWMVRSGMKAFTIGIESGNSKVLTSIRKPTSKKRLRKVRKQFDLYPEVLSTANFVIGFPGETFGQMLDTFEFALELQMDWARFFICQPMQGSEMFTAFQALGDTRTKQQQAEDINPLKSNLESRIDSGGEEKEILYGMDIFSIDQEQIPNQSQLKEIWFTFNLVANILRNTNLNNSGNPGKFIRWVESILSSYPYDAALNASVAYAYRLTGDLDKGKQYESKFLKIYSESQYWQKRARQFPELFRLSNHIPDRK